MTLSKETEVIFDEHRGVDYDSANPPLYDSSTFHQQVLGGNAKFDYARSGNPNRQLLEEKLAKLEGGNYAFAYASGIAAISAVLLTLKANDHVILPDDVYGGTFRLTEQILNRFNIQFTTVNATHPEEIERAIGTALSAHDSWTLAKHLKTLPVRFKQSTANAAQLVTFLNERKEIAEVYYPGNSSLHLSQANSGGAVIGFRLKDETKAQDFVDALTLPLVSVSLGGVETILSHPATMSHAAVPEDVRNERGITFGLFRLSVGLEQPQELIADLNYALKEAFNESIIESITEQRFSS